MTRVWKGEDGAHPTPVPHDSSARKQYAPVLALRCQSGDRETAVAAQGTDRQRTPKSRQAAAQRRRCRVEYKMRFSGGGG